MRTTGIILIKHDGVLSDDCYLLKLWRHIEYYAGKATLPHNIKYYKTGKCTTIKKGRLADKHFFCMRKSGDPTFLYTIHGFDKLVKREGISLEDVLKGTARLMVPHQCVRTICLPHIYMIQNKIAKSAPCCRCCIS